MRRQSSMPRRNGSVLKQQGVYDGKPTGNWDDQTAQAVQDFQLANNIRPTGQIEVTRSLP
jgi:hypothetical protein